MNFQWLTCLENENRFDEIQFMDLMAKLKEKPVYFIALTRRGEQAWLNVLAQTRPEAWDERLQKPRSHTMRSSLKASMHDMAQHWDIQKLTVNDMDLELSGSTACSLAVSGNDAMVFFLKLREAGWQIPVHSIFFEMEWDCIQLIQYELCNPSKQLPDCGNASIAVTYSAWNREYLIEKRVRLTVENEPQGIRSDKKIPFTITDECGETQDGICYINQVCLIDPWKELEQMFALPEYQERALEHMTAEELEQLKDQVMETLEQSCPRGMCHIGIEYECTLDVSLEFYSSSYLKSKPAVHKGSATVLMMNHKPDKAKGTHGLRLKAAMLSDAFSPETKQVQAELFRACAAPLLVQESLRK